MPSSAMAARAGANTKAAIFGSSLTGGFYHATASGLGGRSCPTGSLRGAGRVLRLRSMSMRERFFSFPFRSVIWLLPAALAVHELEEWNIAAWEHAQFENPSDASATAVRLTLLLVVAAGVAGEVTAAG